MLFFWSATAYGRGVYFATTSSYSHGYAQPGQQGHRHMFLAEVITGEYCQGHQNLIVAPTKPGGSITDIYDSVVDNVSNPSMYVVFKDASVYPSYILKYT